MSTIPSQEPISTTLEKSEFQQKLMTCSHIQTKTILFSMVNWWKTVMMLFTQMRM